VEQVLRRHEDTVITMKIVVLVDRTRALAFGFEPGSLRHPVLNVVDSPERSSKLLRVPAAAHFSWIELRYRKIRLLRNADRHPTEMLRQHEVAGYIKLANQKKGMNLGLTKNSRGLEAGKR